ncbi:MAG: hypothetical protein WDN03_18320 [Rhizomicrobium sp.]
MSHRPAIYRSGIGGTSDDGFLRWAGNIGLGVLNGVAKFVVFLVLLFVVVLVIGLVQGDGLPRNMVLALDLRDSLQDSSTSISASAVRR